MERKVIDIEQLRKEYLEVYPEEADIIDTLGVGALVEVENMGFCKNDMFKYYMFEHNGEDCICFRPVKVEF